MIGVGELEALQADFEAWMTETATVSRATVSKVNGTNVSTWADAFTSPVRRRPVTELRGFVSEGEVGGREGSDSYWLLSFPAGTDIRSTDRVTVAGRAYEVTGEFDKTTEIQRQVLAVEVR